jgi:hypothetical protein
MGVSPAPFTACCAETLLADNRATIISRTGPNLLNMAISKNTSNPSHETVQKPIGWMSVGLGSKPHHRYAAYAFTQRRIVAKSPIGPALSEITVAVPTMPSRRMSGSMPLGNPGGTASQTIAAGHKT